MHLSSSAVADDIRQLRRVFFYLFECKPELAALSPDHFLVLAVPPAGQEVHRLAVLRECALAPNDNFRKPLRLGEARGSRERTRCVVDRDEDCAPGPIRVELRPAPEKLRLLRRRSVRLSLRKPFVAPRDLRSAFLRRGEVPLRPAPGWSATYTLWLSLCEI